MKIMQIILLTVTMIATSALFAPTHIYLTNKTPYTLTFSATYTGGKVAPGGFWKNPDINIKPDEKKEIAWIFRESKVETGKTYLFNAIVSFPDNFPSIKLLAQNIVVRTVPGQSKSDLWAAVVTPSNKDQEIDWSTKLDKTVSSSWKANGKTFTATFQWSSELNENFYHDLFFEISAE